MEMIKIAEQASTVAAVASCMDYFQLSQCTIRPHFFMTGPTGSGKSYIVDSLAKQRKLQMLEVNAAQLTREGISGNSLTKALSPLRSMADIPTVIFVDEFDKLLSTHGSADEARLGVQDEFLKVVESDYLSVFGDYGKYARVRADNLLFVFAGVFGDKGDGSFKIDELRELGLRSEFLGRIGLCVSTKRIPISTLVKHIGEADLLDRYLKMHPTIKRPIVVRELRKRMMEDDNSSAAGFRGINTLIHQFFSEKNYPITPAKGRFVDFTQ